MTINVLFLAAEAEPYIKIGGLGDVAGALPKAIHNCTIGQPEQDKVDIRLVLPYHFAIKQRGFAPKYLGEFSVDTLNGSVACQVYRDESLDIPVYFLDGEPIDEKSPVYSPDPIYDGYKFVFFSLAALKLPEFLDWRMDILHANDWHTATAIYALYKSDPHPSTRTIYTLHNLPYMGTGVQQALTDYGLPPVDDPSLPVWARHTPLPLGLLYADKIVAVSPHYAEEILTPELGCGLDDFLKTRQSAIMGILNGLDTEKWNPETDPAIERPFSIETLPAREENKTALQNQFNLTQDGSIPLLTLISRMDPQKGIDIVLRGLAYCQDLPWHAIILGTGNQVVEEMAKNLEIAYPDRVRSVIKFDNTLAHQLYAGADMFMMPSRYEPCGLSQMIAMRYGCVPIARETGGLVDTINQITRKVDGGTGFLFKDPYPSTFASVLKRAIRLYHKPEAWEKIQKNGMRMDFSWEKSAHKYIDIYHELLSQNE
jgi:starch synthase